MSFKESALATGSKYGKLAWNGLRDMVRIVSSKVKHYRQEQKSFKTSS